MHDGGAECAADREWRRRGRSLWREGLGRRELGEGDEESKGSGLAYEVHAHEVHARKGHAREMHAHGMHACEMHVCEIRL